jgi:hypothetical protein
MRTGQPHGGPDDKGDRRTSGDAESHDHAWITLGHTNEQ